RLYRETPAASILAGLIADVQTQGDAADSLRETLINGRRNLITGPLQRAIGENLLPGDFDVAWAADQIVALIWHRLLSDRKKLTD
ncbi:MAG: TetR-like C-terminal domain-containing protein, partial [Rhodospirillales bacterium]|nr:TetR-like C-terminal domain-containing protein [Rhodospirillales bacterium]